MPNRKATAQSCSNIAFIKYWGNFDARYRMPLNDSLSMTLEALTTETTVEFEEGLKEDEIVIGEAPVSEGARGRAMEHLDRIRAGAGIQTRARVQTRNNFPSATGLASSASGFAALTVAAAAAAGLDLSERALSVLARQGSGSAARSIPGGFVEWLAATGTSSLSEHSYARTLMPPDAWDLRDVIAVVTHDPKKVGSSEGHLAALSSPFMSERLSRLPERFHRVKRALLGHDLQALGPQIEAEAIELHMIAMTSRPPIYYWSPDMVRVIQSVLNWREAGLPVYFTLDAGSNVHLICEGNDAEQVEEKAKGIEGVKQVISSGVGGPARLVNSNPF